MAPARNALLVASSLGRTLARSALPPASAASIRITVLSASPGLHSTPTPSAATLRMSVAPTKSTRMGCASVTPASTAFLGSVMSARSTLSTTRLSKPARPRLSAEQTRSS